MEPFSLKISYEELCQVKYAFHAGSHKFFSGIKFSGNPNFFINKNFQLLSYAKMRNPRLCAKFSLKSVRLMIETIPDFP